LISQFAALWFIWIVLINIAVYLFWNQELTVTYSAEYYISFILILMNVIFLALRENYANQVSWLQERWHRILLAIGILVLTMYPIQTFIFTSQVNQISLILSASLGACVQIGFLFFYRMKRIDMWVYALTIMSMCLILCSICYETLRSFKVIGVVNWLLMAIITLLIFTLGAYVLRKSSPPLLKENSYEIL
jgi:hypothetical protein